MPTKVIGAKQLLLAAGLICCLVPQARAAWTEHVLYNFCAKQNCSDGKNPIAKLLMDSSGNLYGTTQGGGPGGGGTIFELVPNANHTKWTHQILHTFCRKAGCTDGTDPGSALIIDQAGNLYGLTGLGGLSVNDGASDGVVYELSPPAAGTTKWTYKVLHVFCAQGATDCTDGNNSGSLTWGQTGLVYSGASTGAPYDGVSPLYGTTSLGGAGGGVVFQLTPGARKWTEKILHNFCSEANGATCPNDGSSPTGQLAIDGSDDLFGTTFSGGAGVRDPHGQGTIFELIPNKKKTQWGELLLYSFCATSSNCPDGANPTSELVQDNAGNIFGTTGWGGLIPCDGDPNGCGSVFKLAPGPVELTLYAFCPSTGCPDGFNPKQGLMIDTNGNLFGTTPQGGNASGAGSVYEITTSGYQLVHAGCSETNCTDGSGPWGGVIMDKNGVLYGTEKGGGTHNGGVVYSITP